MVEQSTAAAHSLAKEADNLFRLLEQFNIGMNASAHSPAAHLRPSGPAASGALKPAASPARQMTAKLARAFHGNAAAVDSDWQEF
jgi:methyl-accepting chemotaxis protein